MRVWSPYIYIPNHTVPYVYINTHTHILSTSGKPCQEVLLEVSKIDKSWGRQETEFLAPAEPASPENSIPKTIIWAD